jgi:hypothetical protein
VAEDAEAVPRPRRVCGGKRFIEIPGRDQMELTVQWVEDMVLGVWPPRQPPRRLAHLSARVLFCPRFVVHLEG